MLLGRVLYILAFVAVCYGLTLVQEPDACPRDLGCSRKCVMQMCTCSSNPRGTQQSGGTLGELQPVTIECAHHDNCHNNNACINNKCVDPCLDEVCGKNAICSVRHHLPSCTCQEGYTGDPFSECKPLVCSGCWPPKQKGVKKFKIEANIKADWQGAIMHCLMDGHRLVAINSKEENDQLLKQIAETGNKQANFWTSGTDMISEARFMWQTTGTWLNGFSDWRTNQPDNHMSKEHCLELWDADDSGVYKWNDRPCGYKSNFICEYYE